MVSIIPEITHGLKNQRENYLVKHIENLAKCFLKTSSEAWRENRPNEEKPRELHTTPYLFVSFLDQDAICAATRESTDLSAITGSLFGKLWFGGPVRVLILSLLLGSGKSIHLKNGKII